MNYFQIVLTLSKSLAMVAVLMSLGSMRARPDTINVDCFNNGDGTSSCQRLSDGEWFDCARSVAGVSSCRSREVVPGIDGPMTCTNNGEGIFTCTGSLGDTPSRGLGSGTSVFDL